MELTGRPWHFRIGRFRFTGTWRSWGCDGSRFGITATGHPSPLAAYRALLRAETDREVEAWRAAYGERLVCRTDLEMHGGPAGGLPPRARTG